VRPTVSVITPTIRPAGLRMVAECLRRQTVLDWEWLIGTPWNMATSVLVESCDGDADRQVTIYAEPPRFADDLYTLNKTWNLLVKKARSDRLVFLVDWIWFPEDTLEKFLAYPDDTGVSSVGHHYRDVIENKPEGRWWTDPRTRIGHFGAEHMELACAALTRHRILDVGGFDEDYDRVAGLSEKELCLRMAADGCRFVLDPDIEIRNWTHPKEFPDWDDRYTSACELYQKHVAEIRSGKRRNIAKEFS
jgi:hypothetical protein